MCSVYSTEILKHYFDPDRAPHNDCNHLRNHTDLNISLTVQHEHCITVHESKQSSTRSWTMFIEQLLDDIIILA